MPNLGVWEILLILLVVLIAFGPKRLPEMGRSLGRGMREFKDSISNAMPTEEDLERAGETDEAARPPGPAAPLTAPHTATPTPTAVVGSAPAAASPATTEPVAAEPAVQDGPESGAGPA